MIQYKAHNLWKPLAGDEQLKALLVDKNISDCDLYICCAPKREF
jgi:hypothetical protein